MSGGYVDPNFPNPGGDGDASIIIYGYTPSFALAVLGCVLFFVTGLAHIAQLVKYRTWYFVTMSIGIPCEIVGYVFRCFSAKKDPYMVIYFVIQYFFIVVAPVFFAAAIYTVLSRLINATGRQYAPLRPRYIIILFVVCDVIATVVQILGAALIGSAESNRKDPTTANNILLGGLAFQAFMFLLFITLLALFTWRARRVLFSVVSKTFYGVFAVAVLLFYIRFLFRMAETAQGLYGELNSREVYFGTLEFMPVVLSVGVLAAWHPGRCIPAAAPPNVVESEEEK